MKKGTKSLIALPFLIFALISVLLTLPQKKLQAVQNSFQVGEVFLAVIDGKVQRRSKTGALIQTLDTTRTGINAGMGFDLAGNLYVTNFQANSVSRFSPMGNLLGPFGNAYDCNPESIVFDRAGNAYVGQAGPVSGTSCSRRILKFDSNGNFLAGFVVTLERRGSDWIELAADQCTMFYTSEGKIVRRFNVCTNTQLSDFAVNLPGVYAFALRLLSDGSMLVANKDLIVRLDNNGSVIQQYDASNEDYWFALNLDPDGVSFWSAGIITGNVYKFNIATGNQLLMFNSGITNSNEKIGGLAIAGEITVNTPKSDLAIIKTASSNSVAAGSPLSYSLKITNNGPDPAMTLTLSDTLPAGAKFQSISSPPGWSCATPPAGQTGTIICTAQSLALGAVASFTINVIGECSSTESANLNNTATITSFTNDLVPANNSSTVAVTVSGGNSALALIGGKTAIDFGTVPASRESIPNPPSDVFTVQASGCGSASLTFEINRTGDDVANGRIINPDDSVLFHLRIINPDGTETPVPIGPGSPPVQFPSGQSRGFRIQFNPLIPILAGKTTGLFANQVLPDVINSQLKIIPGGGTPLTINLTGRISTPLKMIHPTDSRLLPLIVFTRSGDEFTVECSTHDSNLDIHTARYQFLDQNNRNVGLPVDVELTQPISQRGMVKGQSFTIIQKFLGASRSPEINKVQVTLFDRETNAVASSATLGVVEAAVASVSAASFSAAPLASESIVSAFGNGLAASVQPAAGTPLPTSLGGVSVRVRDGSGTERAAPLFFVSPGQINYLVPQGTMVGAATVTVFSGDRTLAREAVQINNASPGLFAANANGQGVASAVLLRVRADGTQQYEPVSQYDQGRNQFVSRPIDFRSQTDQLYLVMFGTGIRFGRSPANVRVRIGGVESQVLYGGPQGNFVGLDQVNVAVPRNLAGRGELDVSVSVDGRTSNSVRINFGGQTAFAQAEQFSPQRIEADFRPVLVLPRLAIPTARDRETRKINEKR